MAGAGAEAEDVVQEAFVKAYRALHRFRRGEPFRPWLLRIVLNEAGNQRRARLRRRTVPFADVPGDPRGKSGAGGAGGAGGRGPGGSGANGANGANRAHSVIDANGVNGVPGPEEDVLGRERRATLLAAVRALPEKDRLVLTCRYLLELSERETAQVLGWPAGTVKSRSARALGRLRALLPQEEVSDA